MLVIESFDIFDTVIVRAVGRPRKLLLLLGWLLSDQGTIRHGGERFYYARLEGEERARIKRPNSDPSIQEIYDEVVRILGLSEDERNKCLTKEMFLEKLSWRVNPLMAKRVSESVNQNRRVLFVSDMYLPSEFIKSQLQHHGVWPESATIYVSCEEGCVKRDGRLFRLISKVEGSNKWLSHRGDDEAADGRGARLSGVPSHVDRETSLNRYEAILDDAALSTGGLSSVMAGASRLARLQDAHLTPAESAIRDVAVGVAGPILTSYVIWLLNECQQRGICRVYFLSRDGELLLDIARHIAPTLAPDVELRYLYGGRQAFHFANLEQFGETELKWLKEIPPRTTIRGFLTRLRIVPEEVKRELNALGIKMTRVDHTCALDFVDRLLEFTTLRELVLQRASEARSLATSYLTQEGLGDSISSAVVDIGWQGRVFRSLGCLLDRSGVKSKPLPICFGWFDTGYADPHWPPLSFLSPMLRATGKLFWDVIPPPVEMFCTGSQGITLGYRREGDKVTPELAGPVNYGPDRWGLAQYRRHIGTFITALPLDFPGVTYRSDMTLVVMQLIREFWLSPTHAEACAWGCFPYEVDQAATHQESLLHHWSAGRRKSSLAYRNGRALIHMIESLPGPLASVGHSMRRIATRNI